MARWRKHDGMLKQMMGMLENDAGQREQRRWRMRRWMWRTSDDGERHHRQKKRARKQYH